MSDRCAVSDVPGEAQEAGVAGAGGVCVLRALLFVHEMVGELGAEWSSVHRAQTHAGAMCAGYMRETKRRLRTVCGRAEELCARTRCGGVETCIVCMHGWRTEQPLGAVCCRTGLCCVLVWGRGRCACLSVLVCGLGGIGQLGLCVLWTVQALPL